MNKGPVKSGNQKEDGEYAQVVLDFMQEVIKNQQTKFCHRMDLWTVLQNQMDHQCFTTAIDTLIQDGAIYTAVDDDQFGIAE